MEKEKRKLPYYLNIKKRKDGKIVIAMRAFRLTAFLQTLANIVFYGIVTYIVINLSKTPVFALHIHLAAICSGFLVMFVFVAIGLTELFGVTNIYLEPTAIIKKTTWKKKLIPAASIGSIRVEAPILQVPKPPPFSHEIETIQKRELILKLYNGEDILLFNDFEDIQPAIDLRDLIAAYYGLNEKPKTKNQSPVTNN